MIVSHYLEVINNNKKFVVIYKLTGKNVVTRTIGNNLNNIIRPDFLNELVKQFEQVVTRMRIARSINGLYKLTPSGGIH